MSSIHFETVTPLLRTVLGSLMNEPLFAPFRLVGGTNMSLRYGHRMSDDIDLFTDTQYGAIDFDAIFSWLSSNFSYCACPSKGMPPAFGCSYYVGNHRDDCVKLDVMYTTDSFKWPIESADNIRLAAIEDIIAMKMDVIQRGGRKKDFWDVHYLHQNFSIDSMIALHAERFEWTHDRNELISQLVNFDVANLDPDPRCLLLKNWDDIRMDFIGWVEELL